MVEVIVALNFEQFFFHAVLPIYHRMPRINHFACYPPFPDNVVVADLPRVSLTKLQQHDVDESARLFQACTEIGFFLLDLTGSSTGETMLDDAGNSFALSQEIFDLEQEELGKYPFIPKNGLHGYVPLCLSL